MTACQNSGHDPRDHFARISKMVDLGSGAKREITDIALTRYPRQAKRIEGPKQ